VFRLLPSLTVGLLTRTVGAFCLLLTAYCFLPTAYCFLGSAPRPPWRSGFWRHRPWLELELWRL